MTNTKLEESQLKRQTHLNEVTRSDAKYTDQLKSREFYRVQTATTCTRQRTENVAASTAKTDAARLMCCSKHKIDAE